ncbi:MAG: N-acetyl sugar amidotransferase [bacterium]
MNYCKRCVMPDTRPDLYFDKNGVCCACLNYEKRKDINWSGRKEELLNILDKYRSKDGSNWDCIVPVSGGKDSTYQVLKLLQLGMNPLCVTATTCDLSSIGRKNIENIKNLGVDYLEFSTNPVIRKKLNRIGLTKVGDISWPEHSSIFTIPVRVAVQHNIPLIIWGENSQNEYGGPAASVDNNILNKKWLEEFGGLLGLRISDLASAEGINRNNLIPYFYPDDSDLKKVRVTGLFLGHYFPWDGFANALLAQANGFATFSKSVEGSMVNYENLDNYQTGIHDYFKYLKFGFGRATDIACLHLRRDRINRDDAIGIVRKMDGKFPWTYLDKKLEDILEPLNISVDEFIGICDKFTNKKIFKTDVNGNLIKDKNGNLMKLKYPEFLEEKESFMEFRSKCDQNSCCD